MRTCAQCGTEMDKEDTGYAYLYTCPDTDCPNKDAHFEVYDPEAFRAVKTVQEVIGHDEAVRLAWEYKDGVLAEGDS